MHHFPQPYAADGTVFDATLLEFRKLPVGSNAQVLATELALLRVFSLFDGQISHEFEQPSNPLFIPAEFHDINCCIPCPPNYPQVCGLCYKSAYNQICFCQAAAPPAPPPPPPLTEPQCSTARVDLVSHRYMSKTRLRLTYNAKNCTMPKVTFTGPGYTTERTNVSGIFAIDYNPMLVPADSRHKLTLTPSKGLPRTVNIARRRIVKNEAEVMGGIAFVRPVAVPVVFNQELVEIYEKFEVGSVLGFMSWIIGGSSHFISTNKMSEPLPKVIGIWNATHRYYNTLKGNHQVKSLWPPSGVGAIPYGATVRVVSSSIDYRPGETSTGKARTTAIHMLTPGGFAFVAYLVNPETDVKVQ